MKRHGFTLAEVLITLAIIGIVAALTIPTIINYSFEREAVSKVKKNYSVLVQAMTKWADENGCLEHVSTCLSHYSCFDCKNGFSGVESQLNIVDRRYQNESKADADWLPDKSYTLDGSESPYPWLGISKVSTNSEYMCDYLLADGTILSVLFPDNWEGVTYGMIYIDINGKKGPNRVGKDQFPMGVGADRNDAFNKYISPFTSSENGIGGGMCVTCLDHPCNADDGYSPTAYLLTHDKLPDLKAMGYPTTP